MYRRAGKSVMGGGQLVGGGVPATGCTGTPPPALDVTFHVISHMRHTLTLQSDERHSRGRGCPLTLGRRR